MKKQEVSNWYKFFLKYYYPFFIILLIIISLLNLEWFPRILSLSTIVLCIVGWIGMYFKYKKYINKTK
ncbi:hypothetical protein [Clostridium sp.]|uniref:hypothetical protein n=1 Tax=Clostridium sp. TaxID=1506 RepID=UPI002604848D|nr:hypothetical protein [Clostridium sp.]